MFKLLLITSQFYVPPRVAGRIGQAGKTKNTTGVRDPPVVRNLRSLLWEPAILTYHHRGLVIPVEFDLIRGVAYMILIKFGIELS